MKLGKYEITFKKSNPTPQNSDSGDVDVYSVVTSKEFSTYKTVNGDQSIDYDIIEDLYEKTIMNRVINKMSGDATRLNYTVNFTDIAGEPHEKAAEVCGPLGNIITREVIKTTFRDMLLYGDAFIYLNYQGKELISAFNINPRYIRPKTDNNNKFIGYIYNGNSDGKEVDFSFEEVLHVANNPITGHIFGTSIFQPILQILTLLLNSQMNTAVILEKFAVPLIQWKVDSGNPRRKTKPSEIKTLLNNIKQMKIGRDIGTDASVTNETIDTGSKNIDMAPILDDLEKTFFASTGLPGQILGFSADNLSALTRQLQIYYESVSELQETLEGVFIEQLYRPYLQLNGVNDCFGISFSWLKPLLEFESRIVTWALPSYQAGLITGEEARNALGLKGKPPLEYNPSVLDETPMDESDPTKDPGVQPSNIIKNERVLKDAVELMNILREGHETFNEE